MNIYFCITRDAYRDEAGRITSYPCGLVAASSANKARSLAHTFHSQFLDYTGKYIEWRALLVAKEVSGYQAGIIPDNDKAWNDNFCFICGEPLVVVPPALSLKRSTILLRSVKREGRITCKSCRMNLLVS